MRSAAFTAFLALSIASLPAAALAQDAATVAVSAGKMIYASNGQRIAQVYRVTTSGDPQIILNGRLVTIAASTLSEVDGKLTTSLARKEIGQAK